MSRDATTQESSVTVRLERMLELGSSTLHLAVQVHRARATLTNQPVKNNLIFNAARRQIELANNVRAGITDADEYLFAVDNLVRQVMEP